MKKQFKVVIPSKQIKKRRNKNGNHYWLLSIPNTTKELFIPFEWLKQSSNGKTYKGSFPEDVKLMGRQRNSINLLSKEIKGVFPNKDGNEV